MTMGTLEELNVDDENETAAVNTARQYLTLVLGEELYGVDILRVQEIKGWSSVTKVPHAPDYVLGVLNLRGSIIPVVDLRLRFRTGQYLYDETTVVVVLKVFEEERERTVGVVVDGVSDVFTIGEEEIREPPEVSGLVATEYIFGMSTGNDRLLMLLDVDRLLTFEDETR